MQPKVYLFNLSHVHMLYMQEMQDRHDYIDDSIFIIWLCHRLSIIFNIDVVSKVFPYPSPIFVQTYDTASLDTLITQYVRFEHPGNIIGEKFTGALSCTTLVLEELVYVDHASTGHQNTPVYQNPI